MNNSLGPVWVSRHGSIPESERGRPTRHPKYHRPPSYGLVGQNDKRAKAHQGGEEASGASGLAFAFSIEATVLPFADDAFFVKGEGHTVPGFRSPGRPLAHLSPANPGTAWQHPIFFHDLVLMLAEPSIPGLRAPFKDVVRACDGKHADQRQREDRATPRRLRRTTPSR